MAPGTGERREGAKESEVDDKGEGREDSERPEGHGEEDEEARGEVRGLGLGCSAEPSHPQSERLYEVDLIICLRMAPLNIIV